MAAAHVQHGAQIEFSSTTVAVTLTAVGAGNLLMAWVGWTSNTITLNSITDDKGNSWTLLNNPTTVGTVGRGAQAYAKNVASGTTVITATMSAAPGSVELHVHEASGLDTTSPLDGNNARTQSGAGTGTDAITSNSVTTTSNGDYVGGASFDPGVATAPNAGTGWTSRALSDMGRSENQIQTSAGSITATFTETESFADNVTLVMAFKVPGGTVALEWKQPTSQPTNHFVPTISVV